MVDGQLRYSFGCSMERGIYSADRSTGVTEPTTRQEKRMSDKMLRQATIQDHQAFLAGNHDFQADIQMLAGSGLVGTILETVMLATNMRFAAV